MSTYGSDVLYREATGLEKAWSDVDADRLIETNAEAIIDIWDPYACPAQLLPFLAWAMGITFWNNKWSETTKRDWIARQFEFKSLRGTQAGIEMALDFAGRDVSQFGFTLVKAITQPQKVFSGPSLTKTQREAWLQKLPQVRVYYYRNRPIADHYKSFMGGWTGHNRRFFIEGMFPQPSQGLKHLERRATYNIGGVDTDITVTNFGNYYQLHIPSFEKQKVFSGRPFGERYFQPSDAVERLFTVAPRPSLPWRGPIGASLQAVDASPEVIKVPGEIGYAVYSNSALKHADFNLLHHKHFFLPSTAKYRIFDRYAINDGSVLSAPRPNVQFMGVGRYGWPAFTAELDVHMPSKQSYFKAGEGIAVPKRRFWIPHDPEPMNYVRRALEASRRLSDKLLLKPVPLARFIAGRPFIAGQDSYVIGRPEAI